MLRTELQLISATNTFGRLSKDPRHNAQHNAVWLWATWISCFYVPELKRCDAEGASAKWCDEFSLVPVRVTASHDASEQTSCHHKGWLHTHTHTHTDLILHTHTHTHTHTQISSSIWRERACLVLRFSFSVRMNWSADSSWYLSK